MNTSMTINATAAWLWGLYLALAEEEGVDPNLLQGTTQNDIVKEYLSRGTYIFAPEPSKRLIVDMIAYGHDHVAKWNPDQRLQLSPPRGRRHAGPGDRLLPGDRHRRPGRRARLGQDLDGADAPRRRTDLVLRERRRALHRRDRQDAHLHRDVGRDLSHALRRPRRLPSSFSLRRAGQLTRSHRTTAREQRAAHRARDARRHAVGRRPGARPAAAGLERGARPPASGRPAVEPAHATGAGLRERPPRIPRHLRRLLGDGGQGPRTDHRARRTNSTTCWPSAAPFKRSTN